MASKQGLIASQGKQSQRLRDLNKAWGIYCRGRHVTTRFLYSYDFFAHDIGILELSRTDYSLIPHYVP